MPGGTATTSVVAVGAVAQRALAVAAALGAEVARGGGSDCRSRSESSQTQHDVAAAAAVAAVGAALGHVRLAAEARRSRRRRRRRATSMRGLSCSMSGNSPHGDQDRRRGPHGRPRLPDHRRLDRHRRRDRPPRRRGRLPRRARRPLARTSSQALAEELGGDERALAVRCDVTEWDDQQALVAARARRLRAARRRRSPTRASARRAASSGDHVGALARDGAHQRLRRGADDPRDDARRCTESKGHLLLTGSVAGRRVLPGSLYSCTKWAVTAMGEALRQDLNGTRRARHADRAGHGRHALLRQPGRPNALEPDDIARAVMFAVSQPPHVDVNEILVRPTAQSGRSARSSAPGSIEMTRPRRPVVKTTVPAARA